MAQHAREVGHTPPIAGHPRPLGSQRIGRCCIGAGEVVVRTLTRTGPVAGQSRCKVHKSTTDIEPVNQPLPADLRYHQEGIRPSSSTEK